MQYLRAQRRDEGEATTRNRGVNSLDASQTFRCSNTSLAPASVRLHTPCSLGFFMVRLKQLAIGVLFAVLLIELYAGTVLWSDMDGGSAQGCINECSRVSVLVGDVCCLFVRWSIHSRCLCCGFSRSPHLASNDYCSSTTCC